MSENAAAWSLPEDVKKILRKRFKELENMVFLKLFVKTGENDEFTTLTKIFLEELERLSDKIKVSVHTIGDEVSKKYAVTASPTILFNPEQYQIRYTGAPFGEEGRSFIETLIMVSHQKSGLSKKSKQLLADLTEPRTVQVFVTLACPYCPGQVVHAFRAAVERPDLVSSECIDAAEHMKRAQEYNVGAVPHTVINGQTMSRGFQPEEQFIAELVSLKPQQPLEHHHDAIEEKIIETDVIIVGAGPAGLTAGMYAARSGLKTVVLEKNVAGGQASITPVVENWPGFPRIPGKQLMEMISKQVREYIPVLEGEEVVEIKIGRYIEAFTTKHRYRGKAVILACGGSHRKLGVPGEDRLYGRGVSYCATCDGFLYKGKTVVVVGGGNTAMTNALYLRNLGAEVVVVNRDAQFHGEQPLKESLMREKMKVIWNTMVLEILGDNMVTGVRIKNLLNEQTSTIDADAVFVAVGEEPENRLAVDLGVEVDSSGFIKVDRFGRTNIPRVYAAGDVTGGVRQIVTAVGSGAAAATSAFEDILHPYWIPKKN
ncbi:MAG: FAD-dependent oxidoreductase [Candidatus Thermoplasmatota archaeon]